MAAVILSIRVSFGSVANDIPVNGGFVDGLGPWAVTSGSPGESWVAAGHTGTLVNQGYTWSAEGGSVRYEAAGNAVQKTGAVGQDFQHRAGQAVYLTFAWKKQWTGATPAIQTARVDVIDPLGTRRTLWSNTSITNNSWQSVQSLLVTSSFAYTGNYRLELYVDQKSGASASSIARTWFDEVDLQVVGSQAPLPPDELLVHVKPDGLGVAWSPSRSTKVTGYRLYRGTSRGGPFSQVGPSPIVGTDYLDNAVAAGTSYYYEVTAIDQAGRESSSTVVYGERAGDSDGSAPETPRVPQLEQRGDELKIQTTPSSGSDVLGYNVYRSADGGAQAKVNTFLLPTAVFIDRTFQSGASLAYRMSAVDRSGNESGLSQASAITAAGWSETVNNGGFVTNLSGWTLSTGSPYITWRSTGADQPLYWGERSREPQGGAVRMYAGSSTLTPIASQTFSYAVSEVGKKLRLSFSYKKDWTGAKPTTQRAAVRLKRPDGSTVTLWSDYAVRNMSAWERVENLDVTSSLLISGTYTLELYTNLGGGDATTSNNVMFDEVWLEMEENSKEVTGIAAASEDGWSADISWPPSSDWGITSYWVYRYTGSSWEKVNQWPIGAGVYEDASLDPGVLYQYQVRGNKSPLLTSSASRIVKVMPSDQPKPHGPYPTNPADCGICHGSHREQGAYLLDRPTQAEQCFRCHGTSGPAYYRVESQFTGTSGHALESQGGPRCAECHDPHEARAIGVTPDLLAGSLRGASGVSATYSAAAWVDPVVALKEPVQREYELCFKCHRTAGTAATKNTPKEFNPNNASQHAVVGASRTSAIGTYVNGWNFRSPMTCSDCHGSGAEGGAHRSSNPNLLRKPYNDLTSGKTPGAICFDCHDIVAYGTTNSAKWRSSFKDSSGTNYHNTPGGHRVACSVCHAAVPHGFDRKGMLVTRSDPLPYRRSSGNISITIPADGNYRESSCSTVGSINGVDCH